MHVNDQTLRSFFDKNPFFHQKLRYLARQKPFFGGVITTKNSPLWPIFKKGTTLLRERSLMDKMIRSWVGKELKATADVEKMVVGAGQVVLVILVMGAAIIMAGVFFCAEITWSLSSRSDSYSKQIRKTITKESKFWKARQPQGRKPGSLSIKMHI